MPFDIDFTAGRNSMRKELTPKIERLRKALEFYANSSNWKKERTASQGLGGPEILFDNGETARNALKD